MPTTKGKIREAAKKLAKGGDTSAGSNITSGQIDYYIENVINELLKTEHYTLTLPSGESVPNASTIAYYENIPIVQHHKKSRAKIPAIPIQLPRNAGVFSVYPSGDPECPFIPLMPGDMFLVRNQKMLNDLLGGSYEVSAGYVEFDKDYSGENKTVDMKLVVMDMSQYGDYDPLPIAADMEKTVVNMVVERFYGGPRPDKVEDSGSEPSKLPRQ